MASAASALDTLRLVAARHRAALEETYLLEDDKALQVALRIRTQRLTVAANATHFYVGLPSPKVAIRVGIGRADTPESAELVGAVGTVPLYLDDPGWEAARPLVDLIWSTTLEAHTTDTPERRAGFQADLERQVAEIADGAVQELYRQEMRRRMWALLRPESPARRRQGKWTPGRRNSRDTGHASTAQMSGPLPSPSPGRNIHFLLATDKAGRGNREIVREVLLRAQGREVVRKLWQVDLENLLHAVEITEAKIAEGFNGQSLARAVDRPRKFFSVKVADDFF